MCIVLEALNFKGLGGQFSNDRKQILLHSRKRGVNREIVLKVVSQLHRSPCQQERRRETVEDRRERTTFSALPLFLKLGGLVSKALYSVSGQK